MENVPATIDFRLQGDSLDKLVATFKNFKLEDKDLPIRPGFGTAGIPVTLRTNYFPVKLPEAPLFEYNVKISPDATARRLRKQIFALLEETAEYKPYKKVAAHDSSAKLITALELPQPLAIEVPYYNEGEAGPRATGGKTYTVDLCFVSELAMDGLHKYLAGEAESRTYNPLPVISALNIVLAQHPSREGVAVGRNRFFFKFRNETVLDLRGGLEAWKGFYSSVRPTYNQLMVNVNVATTAFYQEGNLADQMLKWQQDTKNASFNAFVKGLKVNTTHVGHTKTVLEVHARTARKEKFHLDEINKQISVEEYFRQKYNIRLQHADDIPLIKLGSKNLVPAEVCQIIANQPFKGKLTDDHTAAMITHACKPPNVNAAAIVGPGLTRLGFADLADPLGGFGISIGNKLATVPGRILSAPGVVYSAKNQTVDPRASWNLRGVKFTYGARLSNWAVMLIKDGAGYSEFHGVDDPQLLSTVGGFIDCCKNSGITVASEPRYFVAPLPPKNQQDRSRHAAISRIRSSIQELDPAPTLILVILSSRDKRIYSGLKHLCDVELDIHTICVQVQKFRKPNNVQYFANVALKVNMKLGGVNHGLDEPSMKWLKEEPTMLLGMDVTHPGPGSLKGTPSIAAVVASYDNFFAQYPASIRIQETKKEMISSLTDMMKERLDLYKEKNNNKLPSRLLVYRDGVSEGQLGTVVAEEMPQLIAALASYNTRKHPYLPKLTIVVCGKRHGTRFYSTAVKHADRDGNPRPGTVVDRGVTAIYEYDFFLQAHGGLQGTTRPTHYYVVRDEIKIGADAMQKLTNDISYMFARATKAVSLVSPAYYADLACERGRCYIHDLLQASDVGTSSSGGSTEESVYRQAERLWGTGVGQKLSRSMFYL